METIIVGGLAILIGGLLLFWGYTALRIVIAVWGSFAGFMLGSGLVAAFTDGGWLGTGLGWIVGVVTAVIFGLIAYLYYAVSVVIGMAAIGFSLGSVTMAAIGVDWTWLIILAGVAVGVLLAVLAIVGDLPMLILTLLGAFAGSSVMIAGLLLVTGVIDRAALTDPATTQTLQLGWWWNAAYLGLAVAGIVVQLRSEAARRGTLREQWS